MEWVVQNSLRDSRLWRGESESGHLGGPGPLVSNKAFRYPGENEDATVRHYLPLSFEVRNAVASEDLQAQALGSPKTQ